MSKPKWHEDWANTTYLTAVPGWRIIEFNFPHSATKKVFRIAGESGSDVTELASCLESALSELSKRRDE